MRRPSFQFYPGDWVSNSNLNRCTDAEQGIWVRVLCVLHDQEEQYGVVRWPLRELALAAKCKVSDLKSLAKKGVLKGADVGEMVKGFVYVPRSGRKDGEPVSLIEAQDGPLWYSSRFVKDEYVRTIRGSGTRFGADGDADSESPKGTSKGAPKASPKPPIGEGQGDGPSTSASPSPSVNNETPHTPHGGQPAVSKKREGKPTIEFKTFLTNCRESGEKPIAEGDPVFEYAEEAGIPHEWLALQWSEFKARYSTGAKKYKDWREVFRKSVRGNWFKLWYIREDNTCGLTTQGVQAKAVFDSKAAK